MSTAVTTSAAAPPPPTASAGRSYRWLLIAVGFLAIVSSVRVISGANEIDSVGTLQAALIATCPSSWPRSEASGPSAPGSSTSASRGR